MDPLYTLPQNRAVSFRDRSRFETRQTPGIAPRNAPALLVNYPGGVPTINGVPIPPSDSTEPHSTTVLPTLEQRTPTPQYDPSRYSDAETIPVVFSASGEQLVLRRPSTTRISLLIVNLSVVGNIFYVFNRTADNVSCVPIGAGGNRLFDNSVPQGELHIFASGAGTVIVEYMNRDITHANYR